MSNFKNILEAKALIPLNHQIKVYIPSTTDINKEVDNSKYINYISVKLSDFFGGCTSYQAIGSWNSEEVGLVCEKVNIIYAFCSEEDLNKHIEEVLMLCDYLKKEMKQEAVSLEVDNKLYFI